MSLLLTHFPQPHPQGDPDGQQDQHASAGGKPLRRQEAGRGGRLLAVHGEVHGDEEKNGLKWWVSIRADENPQVTNCFAVFLPGIRRYANQLYYATT